MLHASYSSSIIPDHNINIQHKLDDACNLRGVTSLLVNELDDIPQPAQVKPAAGKHQPSDREESNFMKLIREQGLDKRGGGKEGKTAIELALEEDLREIEELKKKLGGNWREDMAEGELHTSYS